MLVTGTRGCCLYHLPVLHSEVFHELRNLDNGLVCHTIVHRDTETSEPWMTTQLEKT